MTNWNPREKPDAAQCPQCFCFFWGASEPRAAPRCLCSHGVCTRLDHARGDHDWYEPHESELEEAGLPWFYFVPSPEILVGELRDDYIAESQVLWGEKHWL